MLASLLYPYDDDAKTLMGGWLLELEREECIQRYTINGDEYIAVTNWLKHQKIDKPSASKLPQPPEPSRILANPRERSSEDQDQGRDQDQGSRSVSTRANENWDFVGKVAEPDESALMDAFAVVRAVYPKRSGRDTWPYAERHWRTLVDSGIPIQTIFDGVERYASYCLKGGVSGPAFVLDPVKFFGATDKPWSQAWEPPPTKAETKRDSNLDASVKWLESSNAG